MTVVSMVSVPTNAYAKETNTDTNAVETKTDEKDTDNIDLYPEEGSSNFHDEELNLDDSNAFEKTSPQVSGTDNKISIVNGDTYSYIVGELQSYDLDNDNCILIGGFSFPVSDDWQFKVDNTNLAEFFLKSSDKTVVATRKDGKITKLRTIENCINPSVSLEINPTLLSYENGKFNSEKILVNANFSLGTTNENLINAIKGYGISLDFSGYELELGKGLHFKGTLRKYQTEKSSGNISAGSVNFDAYPNKNAVVEASQTIKIRLSSKCMGKDLLDIAELKVTNVNVANQIHANKQAEQEAAKALTDTQAALNKTTIALSELPNEYTTFQKSQVNSAVQTWIGQILVSEVLSRDTGDSQAFWDYTCKSAGFGDADRKKFITKITKNTLKKLGVDVSPILDDSKFSLNWEDTEASTEIRLYKADGKKYDKITVELTFGSMNFIGGKPFTGQGTITYTIKTADNKNYNGIGSVSFANLETFGEGMTDLCMAEMEKIYNMDVAQYMNNGYSFTRNFINKTTSSKIVEAITSDAADKILQKKYGSFSDNVFKFYTKEITRTTKGSNKCPVDIYIYDSNGTLCGYVVDNNATVLNDAIKLTCEGDAKYWELSGDNYYITAVGNGDGKMKYEVSEYQNSELVRTITYNDIPLENGLSYTSMVPYAVMSDSGVYNVVSLEDGNPQAMTSDKSYSKDDDDSGNNDDTDKEEPEYEKGELVDSGTCGDNLEWFYYDNGLLEITGSGKMADYSPWYKYKSSIKTIKLSKSLESIDDYAFSGCTGLTSVTYNAINCTKMGGSSYHVFENCTNLTKVTIGEKVETIPDSAFYGCTGLTSITIPESVTNIGGYAFESCTGLTQIPYQKV